MNYGSVLRNVPYQLRKLFRNKESLIKKIINLNWSKKFNETCLKENLLPSYTKFFWHGACKKVFSSSEPKGCIQHFKGSL